MGFILFNFFILGWLCLVVAELVIREKQRKIPGFMLEILETINIPISEKKMIKTEIPDPKFRELAKKWFAIYHNKSISGLSAEGEYIRIYREI